MGGEGGRIRALAAAALVGTTLVLGACKPLREYPAAQQMVFGSAARAELLGDPTYATTLSREFGALVPENELKWSRLRPNWAQFNFGPVDELVNFARSHNMRVRGVPLVWNEQNPAWLTETTYTRAQLRSILKFHISNVVGRYRGRISQWDVVNEPFAEDGTLRANPFRRLGTRYMDEAFTLAAAADPSAKLFLNERRIETPGPKADAVFNAVASMRSRGVPVHGVGLQMHAVPNIPTSAQLAAQMARYASIGVEVAITEMDVRLLAPATPDKLEAQARAFRDALSVCRSAPNCNTFMMWGFTDRHSWVPQFYAGHGAATIHDANYGKKPAYHALNEFLRIASGE
jgi:endo-1,4-beta-xylanase